jgi:hypothetical protein
VMSSARMGRTRRAATRPVDEVVQCAVCETVLVLMPKLS